MSPILKKLLSIFVIIFALIGFVFTCVFIGMQFGIFNVKGSISERNQFFATSTQQVADKIENVPCADLTKKTCTWNETPEWQVIKGGLIKDKAVIERVSKETGVPPRILASVVIPEQTRFFTAEREIFKKYFEPLKILGSLSQFSLGVSGIKQETAVLIEKNLIASSSPFYLGEDYTSLIAYPAGVDHDKELYSRLTNSKDHYYSYLYTALFVKEVQNQWSKSGFSIENNAGILVTLFNLGFQKSIPNPSPKAGGATISTGGATYTYGDLGELFYRSDELLDVFPR